MLRRNEPPSFIPLHRTYEALAYKPQSFSATLYFENCPPVYLMEQDLVALREAMGVALREMDDYRNGRLEEFTGEPVRGAGGTL